MCSRVSSRLLLYMLSTGQPPLLSLSLPSPPLPLRTPPPSISLSAPLLLPLTTYLDTTESHFPSETNHSHKPTWPTSLPNKLWLIMLNSFQFSRYKLFLPPPFSHSHLCPLALPPPPPYSLSQGKYNVWGCPVIAVGGSYQNQKTKKINRIKKPEQKQKPKQKQKQKQKKKMRQEEEKRVDRR